VRSTSEDRESSEDKKSSEDKESSEDSDVTVQKDGEDCAELTIWGGLSYIYR
jgi:hypothetical protein